MYKGKMKLVWYPAAKSMCITANMNRDTKKKHEPFEIEDFLPQMLVEKKQVIVDNKLAFATMKAMFCKENVGKIKLTKR